MFKNLLLSLGTITVVGGIAIAGTQALLSDEVTLTANTFSTGSVDLQISVGSGFANTQVGFSQTMLPGHYSDPKYFWLRNDLPGDPMSIQGQATNLSGTINSDRVQIEIIPVNPDNSAIDGTTGVKQSLTDWGNITALGNPNIPAGQNQKYKMTVYFESDITAELASSIFDFNFTGTQVAPTE